MAFRRRRGAGEWNAAGGGALPDETGAGAPNGSRGTAVEKFRFAAGRMPCKFPAVLVWYSCIWTA